MKKGLLASVLLVMGSITQQIAAESHYYPPRYATQSFAPDVVVASGTEEAGTQESAQKMEAREQQNNQADSEVTALPYSGPAGEDLRQPDVVGDSPAKPQESMEGVDREDEEVVESRVNVPGDED